MSKTTKWVLAILGAFLLFFGLFIFSIISWFFSEPADESESFSGDRVAIVELREPIIVSENIVRQFKKYRENSGIKAIVFRVESPGGGVSASQEIYEEVKKTTEVKPVVVSMGSVAASGGYYVSVGATKIVANPGTLTGSIGVILQFYHIQELMKKIGIDQSTFKSGKLKDIGSPFRKTTEEEKAYLQDLIMDVYDQFLHAVAVERDLAPEFVKKYADGRVFTGRQAYEYGFVDTLGTMQDAIKLAAELGGIKGKPKTVQEFKRLTFIERVVGDAASEVTKLRNEFLNQPILQYRFTSPQ
ncbi:MAG: signal peptide peptidase SppA [Ignavibacteriales bacterium]|nr:signal peptide peptidase SppA [Ignavibacteriales bacterium]